MSVITLFVTTTGLAASFVALVMMLVLLNDGSGAKLQELSNTYKVVSEHTLLIQSTIPYTNGNLSVLIGDNNLYNKCINDGNALCSNTTQAFIDATNNFTTIYTIGNINTTYQTTFAECNSKRDALLLAILAVSPGGSNLPILLQNATIQVAIGTDVTVATYQQYVKKIDTLNIHYMVINPWQLTVTSVNNTFVTFGTGSTGCSTGIHKMLQYQSSGFTLSSFIPVGYEVFCDAITTLRLYTDVMMPISVGNVGQIKDWMFLI